MERTGEMHFLHPHKQREDRGTDFPANTATATATATAAAVSVDDDDDDNDAVKPGYARIQRNANEAEGMQEYSALCLAKNLNTTFITISYYLVFFPCRIVLLFE